jgi:iron complex transport system ATP-binding protein
MMKNGRIFSKGDPESVLTPENILSVYGVDSTLKREDGKPYIVPIRHKKKVFSQQ